MHSCHTFSHVLSHVFASYPTHPSDGSVLSLREQHELLYEREYEQGANWHVARNLTITASFSECGFKPPPKGRQLEAVAPPMMDDGLYVRSPNPPNPPGPPHSPKPPAAPPPPPHVTSPPPTPFGCDFGARIEVNATLAVVEKPVGPLYLVLYTSHDWKHWVQASTVDVETSRFIVEPADVGSGAPPPAANGSAPYLQAATVQEYACVQQPDFLYLVGCVLEGWIPGKVDEKVTPPFANCVAIDGICGATCGSGVFEPTYFDPSKPGYMKPDHMHCF